MLIKMQTWLFVLMTVGNEPGKQMHHEIDGAAMARMLNLRDILSWSMMDSIAVPKQFASQPFHHLRNWRPIIDVAWSETTGQQFTSIINRQVQLEAKEPAHAGLATPGVGGKDAMLTDPFGITDLQRSRVNEYAPKG